MMPFRLANVRDLIQIRPVPAPFVAAFSGPRTAKRGGIRAETTEAQRHGDGSKGLKMGRSARVASQVPGAQRVSFFGFGNRPILSRFGVAATDRHEFHELTRMLRRVGANRTAGGEFSAKTRRRIKIKIKIKTKIKTAMQ